MYSLKTVQIVLRDKTITAEEVNRANRFLGSRLKYGETIQMGDVRKYVEEDRYSMRIIAEYRKKRGAYEPNR